MSIKAKILFLGTSDFAVSALQALLDSDYEIVGVVTVPDQPVGRKKELTPSPIKILAQKNNLQVFQPEKLRGNTEFFDLIKDLKPDLGITAAYGKIIPQELLDMPILGIINIHPSLLPKYRGPSPIQYALLNGDTETGVTIMQVDAQIDHGAVLKQTSARIELEDNYLTLEERLSRVGAELLTEVLPGYISGKFEPRIQDESEATFTKMIKTEDGEIRSSDSMEQAINKIRALNPEPGTYVNMGARVKILSAEGSHEESSRWPSVKLTDGYLLLKTVQPAGKKVMSGDDWLRGQK